MKISTKGRYALRMLIDLIQHQNEGYIALKDVANRQQISKKYLEQIVPTLSKGGIIMSSRGFQGGYRLIVHPQDCTVGQILRLTEGAMTPIPCLDCEPAGCENKASCSTLNMWLGLEKAINDYIDNITLQDIVDNNTEKYRL